MEHSTKTLRNSNSTAAETKVFLLIGIIFIGANLRAPLTSVGPLLSSIREQLHLSSTAGGMLTTVPLLAFAALSPFAAKVANKVGMGATLFLSLLLLTMGIFIRSTSGVDLLFIGTLFIGLAIAVCNVLLPSLIKQDFAHNVGLMTGVYAVSMNLCGAIGSGISHPISVATSLGWKGALGCWGILSFIALLLWLPQLKKPGYQRQAKTLKKTPSLSLWKSKLAWQISLYMGLQSVLFYTIIAWMPDILKEQGLTSDDAGWTLSFMQLAIIPFTFLIPIIAGKLNNQRGLVTISGVLLCIGIIGILYGPLSFIKLFIISSGIGIGSAFSLAMMFFTLRTSNAKEAAELSGMAQSLGYLLAALGPFLFGLLHDVTHGWTIPLFLLLFFSLLLFLCGMGAGKNRVIENS
ncbi:CynX/NimT family MFS transporter [Priestia endophytica]|uniref:CynX/NimT family MFS transporter n=1 Tax=Priestia endophytica TaxID=135735 RepID=UPI00124E43F3|nr:MFS transporter [Priestia endophytica]KAB2495338.1 MFS transporter [Priestia endophytica]